MLPALVILIAAVIPTLIYVFVFYWADRYQREPVWLLLVAFVWGAGPAIVVSIMGELLVETPLLAAPGVVNLGLISNVLIAPVIEEVAKWLALLAIFFSMRREFDGPLDGLIYGALIGFGFAMTENIFFFIGAYQSGGYEELSGLIFMRSLLFGMNHAFYTALAGIGLGMAGDTNSRTAGMLWALAGLLAAICAHALHNFTATLGPPDSGALLYSVMLAAANLGLIIIAVVLSWRQEQRAIRTELADEVGVTLRASEYKTLSGSWRQPLRLHKPDAAATRTHRCVELALCKARLHRRGPVREPALAVRIFELREDLRVEMIGRTD